jgi:CRISPR-associated protein Cas5d
MKNQVVVVGFRGEVACFTMPSVSKQNRFSAPVITPSAARGCLSSIFKKPEFDWVVRRIAVMDMGTSDTFTVMEGNFPKTVTKPFNISKKPVMVTMRIIRNPDYIIEAEPCIINPGTPESPNTKEKYVEQFNRRLDGKKQFYQQPCFGLREFGCRVYKTEFPEHGVLLPDITFKSLFLGWSHQDQRGDDKGSYPVFSDLTMRNGIIEVPWFVGTEFKPGEEVASL